MTSLAICAGFSFGVDTLKVILHGPSLYGNRSVSMQIKHRIWKNESIRELHMRVLASNLCPFGPLWSDSAVCKMSDEGVHFLAVGDQTT